MDNMEMQYGFTVVRNKRNKPVKLSTLSEGDKFRIPDGSDALTTYTHNGTRYGKVFALFINILDNEATTTFGVDMMVIKL